MKNKYLRPIYYDTETTGLSPKDHRIIEIAAYDPDNNKTFHHLINPKMVLPEETKRITGITDEMVEKAPLFKDILPDFIKFCEGDSVLIAHNNDAFDFHFLKHEFLRAEIDMPSWRYIDTLKWARKYRPDLPRHSLQYLREIYNIDPNNAHRALDDVYILEKVFKKMIDDLDIYTVYKLLHMKKKIVRMPFGKHQGKPLSEVPSNYVKWLMENGAFDKDENKELKKEFQKILASK